MNPYDVPKEVMEAERVLSRWFTQQGITTWQLGDCCSRNHAYELEGVLDRCRAFLVGRSVGVLSFIPGADVEVFQTPMEQPK